MLKEIAVLFAMRIRQWIKTSWTGNGASQKDGARGRVYSLLSVSTAVILAGWLSLNKPAAPAVTGYLSLVAQPSDIALNPPPAEGSEILAIDEDVAKRGVAMRDTSRWRLAVADADLSFPHAANTFACALGIPITEEITPHLFILLRRTLIDASQSTVPAKNLFNRDRPFEINNEPICTPKKKKKLALNGAYPSGHAAIGWAWAMVLSEIAPERSKAILQRGRMFGESRIVCNVHWYSDVLAGYDMGFETVKRLRKDPLFLADLEAAKAELAAVRSKGLEPSGNCQVESLVLASNAPGIFNAGPPRPILP